MLAGFDKLTHLVLNTGLYTAHNVVGRLAARLPSLRYVRKDRALVIDRNEDGLYVGHHGWILDGSGDNCKSMDVFAKPADGGNITSQ